jgi:hypothetical protein
MKRSTKNDRAKSDTAKKLKKINGAVRAADVCNNILAIKTGIRAGMFCW